MGEWISRWMEGVDQPEARLGWTRRSNPTQDCISFPYRVRGLSLRKKLPWFTKPSGSQGLCLHSEDPQADLHGVPSFTLDLPWP